MEVDPGRYWQLALLEGLQEAQQAEDFQQRYMEEISEKA